MINNKPIINEINNNIIRTIEYPLNNQLFLSQPPKVKLTNNSYKSFEYDHLLHNGIDKDSYTLMSNNNKCNELIAYYSYTINIKSKENMKKFHKSIGLKSKSRLTFIDQNAYKIIMANIKPYPLLTV